MKRSLGPVLVLGAVLLTFAMPAVALAFQVTGGGGTQTQNPYGMWYAGKEACAQEGCHSQIASKPSPHSTMVTDVKANPTALQPTATSTLWPYSSPLGGISLLPRDIYLQIGDAQGFHEYVGAAGSVLGTKVVPADDLPLWEPMLYLIEAGAWRSPTAPAGNRVYGQSCAACHNVGVTRPSDATYTLPSGATQTSATPTTVSEFGVQCESCHGSGKNPGGHKPGVPGVVSGFQMLKAQVCGQCHVTGTTPQKNVAGSAFGNPNGFTTDATLSAYLTPTTVVESETTFMDYVNGVTTTKPKFLPNGDDYSMRHDYYNEWLDSSHGARPRASVVGNGNPKCLRCHSGLGFLNRIDAKAPNGTRLVPTVPTSDTVTAQDPGISCQVCHDGHVSYASGGGYDATRRWGNGRKVSCGDCHNWRYEILDYAMQYETIGGVQYTRPPANRRPHPATREMVAGGYGGEDGKGGLWGVAPVGTLSPGTTCQDCHMPRTYKEDMPANDDGSNAATRMSHRFHVTYPGDAIRWKLRPNGDSCAGSCHKAEAADYTRADFQAWIDQKRSALSTASADTSASLAVACTDLGLSPMRSLESTQPTSGPAAALDPARWAMLQHAAQNFEMITRDGSGGLHNPDYAFAGFAKARLWAQSETVTLVATLGAGPALGEGMTVSGSLHGAGGVPMAGAAMVLETSVDGGSTWTLVVSGKASGSGSFALATGRIVGSRLLRVRFTPSEGVDYVSSAMAVDVPVTMLTAVPASVASTWTNTASALVSLNATPGGSLTFYSLSGATVRPIALYTGAFTIAAQGETDVHFWSTNADGTEATHDVPVRIDRSNPQIYSDAAAGYEDTARVHIWAMDPGAGVDHLFVRFRGASWTIHGSSFALTTHALGKNSLAMQATDGAGKGVSKTVVVWVRTAPKLSGTPATTRRIRRRGSVAFSVKVRSHLGAAIAGQAAMLQRWSARGWVTVKTVTTNYAGVATKRMTFSASGTSSWRWHVASGSRCHAASSYRVKVVVN